MQDVDGFDESVEPNEVVFFPRPHGASDEVFDLEGLAGFDAPDSGVEVNRRFACGVRVDVRDNDDRVGLSALGERRIQVL